MNIIAEPGSAYNSFFKYQDQWSMLGSNTHTSIVGRERLVHKTIKRSQTRLLTRGHSREYLGAEQVTGLVTARARLLPGLGAGLLDSMGKCRIDPSIFAV